MTFHKMCRFTFISHVYDLSCQDGGEIKGKKAVKPANQSRKVACFMWILTEEIKCVN